jgi:hypothetical protein
LVAILVFFGVDVSRATSRKKNVPDSQKKTKNQKPKKRKGARMDARDRFHLARAQAHLAAGDSSRAARHLSKCAFGIGKVPDAPVAKDVVRQFDKATWAETWAKKTPAEKDAAKERLESRRAALDAEQRALYEEKRRVFERTGAPRFGDEQTVGESQDEWWTKSPAEQEELFARARQRFRDGTPPRYESAAAAAEAYEAMTEEHLKQSRNGPGLRWSEFRQAIVDARKAGDFNKVFDLAVRQQGFWNANDLGAGFMEYGSGRKSIAKLIRETGKPPAEETETSFGGAFDFLWGGSSKRR